MMCHKLNFLFCGALAFLLAACNVPTPKNPWPSPASTPAALQMRADQTTTEKAVAVASAISQKYRGSLTVSATEIAMGGLNIFLVDGNTQKIAKKPVPLRVLWRGNKVSAPLDLYGLVYAIQVSKPDSLFTQQDVDGALADLFSQSAQTFTNSDTKNFSFIEVVVASPSLELSAYHVPIDELFAERDQGADTDWVTFVQNHKANISSPLVFTIPSSSDASPSPAATPGA